MRQHAELLVGWQGIPVFFMIVLLRNRDVLHLEERVHQLDEYSRIRIFCPSVSSPLQV